MIAPEDDADFELAGSTEFESVEYRGILIQRETAGRIGTPPGRPLYQYCCTLFHRRLVRISLDELKKAIDEMIDG